MIKMRTLFLSFAILASYGLSAQNFWQHASENAIPLSNENYREVIPQTYETFALDLRGLKTYLKDAPMQRTSAAQNRPLSVELPLPDGELHEFLIHESPVMKPELSAKYPGIKSYAGYSKTNKEISVRFMYGDAGFSASFRQGKEVSIIEPYAKNIADHYVVYNYRNNTPEAEYHNFICGVNDDDEFFHPDPETEAERLRENMHAHSHSNARTTENATAEIREYEMAMAGVAEWTALHGGTVSGGLSAVNQALNLLNTVLGAEASLRFVLIPNNDLLIYTDPITDPYNMVTLGGALLQQNQINLNATIGNAAYDIGHVLTVGCSDVGGVVSGTVCTSSNKGRGVTCQGGSLTGAILGIAVHEIAHQFNADHTWNNCSQGTLMQRREGSAYEPGSGSTIMSYAGACGAQNVQFGGDVYYHVRSLEQMYNHSVNGGGATCPDVISDDNNIPEIELPYKDGFYIPISTPFELTAVGSDLDTDNNLTYSWEQYNLGPLADLGTPTLNGPSFRSFPPNESPTRIFPTLQIVLTNNQSQTEVLPTYDRVFNFRCTVRDNDPDAGAATWEEMEFFSTNTAGPFRVTYPNSNETLKVGDYIEVLWNVANTDNDLVNCQKVDILLSDNGGTDNQYILAEGVPNTGSHFVTIPDAITSEARIKIRAADNIFFDVSNFNSEIIAPDAPGYAFSAGPFSQQACAPSAISYDLNTISLLGYDSLINFSVSGLPAGANALFSKNPALPSEGSVLTIETANITDEGLHTIDIQAIATGGDTLVRTVTFDIVLNDFSDMIPVSPANGSSGIDEVPAFSWDPSPNAIFYDIEIADSPTFSPTSIIETAAGLTNPTYTPEIVLEKNTLYFWRIRAENECGKGTFTAPQGFHTQIFTCSSFESINVPVGISGVGTPTVESTLVINSQGDVNDLNIKNVKGAHNLVRHLDLSLVGPDETEVVLFSGICGVATVFNMGLDDEASLDIQCPPTSGATFKPQGSLADFNNRPATGVWTMKATVTDNAGTGGTLESWSLELCSSASANAPFLVRNELMPLPPGAQRAITDEFLLAQDDDNGPSELTYTIVTAPEYGTILFQDVPVEVGMTFRQSSLNAGNVKYEHNGGPETSDGFTFAVQDGEGGWFGTPRFEVEIDPDVIISTKDLDKTFDFSVFPNPAQNQLNLQFNNPISNDVEVYITNVQGQVLYHQFFDNVNSQLAIETTRLSNGIYFIYVKNANATVANKKFVIQR